MSYVFHGRGIVDGTAVGRVLISEQPISFYGGVDPNTGVIRERKHPLQNISIKNRILFFPYGKGSTVGSYIIFSLAKNSSAPKAIINIESEQIVIIGCMIANIPLIDKVDKVFLKMVENNDIVKVVVRNGIGKIFLL